jgi:pimeloyl-ACP methyl ester carboxylesterase
MSSNFAPHVTLHRSAAQALWAAARRQLSVRGLRRLPPIWREGRILPEYAALRRHPVRSGVGLPKGDGRPVFLIPGYWAGDASLAPMARALEGADYRVATAGILLNVGCATALLHRIEARLEAHVATHGGTRAFIVGQSRGGTLGRWLAARRPDLVAGLVTLGSPLRDPLAVNPVVLLNIGLVGSLGSLGMPGLLSMECLRADRCCAAAWREGTGPLPDVFPFLSIYSRSDGIVDWRACFDPAARVLEVESSHCGMSLNVDVLRAVGAELARPRP